MIQPFLMQAAQEVTFGKVYKLHHVNKSFFGIVYWQRARLKKN